MLGYVYHEPTHRCVCREGAGSRMEGGMKGGGRGRTLIIQTVMHTVIRVLST